MFNLVKLPFIIVRKSIIPIMLIGLLFSNGMTLFNAGFHDMLYGALSSVVPSRWQKNSPSSKLRKSNIRLKTIDAKTKTIAKRVSKRTARNISANLTAIPTEAMPMIGIAVVIGTTAMDLKDACNDMKDMDQLMNLVSSSEESEADKVCGLEVPTWKDIKDKIM